MTSGGSAIPSKGSKAIKPFQANHFTHETHSPLLSLGTSMGSSCNTHTIHATNVDGNTNESATSETVRN